MFSILLSCIGGWFIGSGVANNDIAQLLLGVAVVFISLAVPL